MLLGESDLIQVDATVIAGLLVLFTISSVLSPPSPQESNQTTTQPSNQPPMQPSNQPPMQVYARALRTYVLLYSLLTIIPFGISSYILTAERYVFLDDKNLEGNAQNFRNKLFRRALKATRVGFIILIFAGTVAVILVFITGITEQMSIMHIEI